MQPGDQGWLLRAWRMSSNRTQLDVATQLGVGEPAISGWERGKVALPHERLHQLDAVLGGDGTLEALLWAATTPHALGPRSRWVLNLTGPEVWTSSEPRNDPRFRRPSWLWLRSTRSDGRLVALIRWGPVFLRVDDAVGPAGLLVTAPVTVANPPVIVDFTDYEGWADVGPGSVPVTVLAQVDAMRRIRVHPRPDPATWEPVRRIRRVLARAHPNLADTVVARFGHEPFITDALAVEQRGRFAIDLTTKPPPIGPSVERPDAFRQARKARHLSQPGLADLATSLAPDHPVTAHHVRRLEEGAHGDVEHLRSRLDHLLGAGGLLCCEAVTVRRATVDAVGPQRGLAGSPASEDDPLLGRDVVSYDVEFPDWWVGPVWVRFLGPEGVGFPVLRWWPWFKPIKMRSTQSVALRRPLTTHPPLRVEVGKEWQLEAGVGSRTDAHDVNEHWGLAGKAAERALQRSARKVYEYAFDLHPGEAARLALENRRRRTSANRARDA